MGGASQERGTDKALGLIQGLCAWECVGSLRARRPDAAGREEQIAIVQQNSSLAAKTHEKHDLDAALPPRHPPHPLPQHPGCIPSSHLTSKKQVI
ncbi:uncharacterized [Tachysurus ichikawai]